MNMKKKIEQDGHKFEITVDFCTTITEGILQQNYHTVTITGDNGYHYKDEVMDSKLVYCVEKAESGARQFVAMKMNGGTYTDARLVELGFE